MEADKKISRLKSFKEEEDDKIIDASPVIVRSKKEDRRFRKPERENVRDRDRRRDRDRDRDRDRKRDRDSDGRNRHRSGRSSSKSKEPLLN